MKIPKSSPARLAYMKQYRTENRERINQWRRDHRDTLILTERVYQEQHRTRRRLRRRNRYKNDPAYRTYCNLRSRIAKVLKGKSKSETTLKLLGCDLQTFLKFIESKFSEGMTWENQGLFSWHLDHIIPCSAFDLTKPEEQAKCFHYTNYQPLWAKDNLRKSNHIKY